MENEERLKLIKPHIIICEGKDDERFLIWLLNNFVQEGNNLFDEFQVINANGRDNLHMRLASISGHPGFDDPKNAVVSIVVIFYAEKDAAATAHKIKNAFNKNGFAEPSAACTVCSNADASKVRYPKVKTGFALFPGCDEVIESGTLEDLCLRSLANENSQEVLSSADCALEKFKSQLSRIHKNRLHTYFSLTDEYVSKTIGQAAQANAFRTDVPAIDSLKSFLMEMHG